MKTLFDTVKVGALTLPNRLVMAPLTRMRSRQPGNTPWELNAEYYAQRASAGLIVSEATQISPAGQGYPATPGIHTREQVQGWSLVTQAVHDAGGRIYLQLWHVGRISHSSFQPDGGAPLAPSAVRPEGMTMTAAWKRVPFETPRAMTGTDIEALIADYRAAAAHAREAGFDGVEVHGANGYLLDQFLQDGSNQRVDAYGGSKENRARLLLEVLDAVIGVWGADRVGLRLSPYGTFNDMRDRDPEVLFRYVMGEVGRRGLAYLHLIEPRASGAGGGEGLVEGAPDTARMFRHAYPGMLVSAGGYTPASAVAAISAGLADMIAFGRLFIANPDLPERLRTGAALNAYDRGTFYGGDAVGYTDYPRLVP